MPHYDFDHLPDRRATNNGKWRKHPAEQTVHTAPNGVPRETLQEFIRTLTPLQAHGNGHRAFRGLNEFIG